MTTAAPEPGRPTAEEFAPYYGNYIALVPDGDVRQVLRAQLHETLATLSGLSDDAGNHAYGPGKWTLKEVIGHMSDAERVFAYRMLRIARADETPLASFDENLWVPASCANDRSVDNLLLEFSAVRLSTVALADSLPAGAWTRRGTASSKSVSVRALGYITAGHAMHHLRIIRERYLAG